MKERKKYIDTAKFIGVFLVIHGHAAFGFTKARMTASAFHMPLFFVLYGLVASDISPERRKLLSFLERRAKTLLVPYVLWAMIYAPSLGTGFWKNVLIGNNVSLGAAGTNQVLWFLPCMFLAALIFAALGCGFAGLDRHVSPYVSRIAAAFLLMAAGRVFGRPYMNGGHWFSADVALVGCVFMLLGSLPVVRAWTERVHQTWPLCAKLGGGILCLAATFGLALLNAPNFEGNSIPCVIMALGIYGNYALFFSAAVVGSMAALLFAMVIERFRVFGFLGRYSLTVMAVHYILFLFVKPWCAGLKELPHANYIYPFAVACVCTVLCIPICMVIKWGCSVLNGDRN